MERCCVCGKKAEYYHDGRWWCEDHSHSYDEKASRIEKSGESRNEMVGKKSNEIELGLHWI